MTTLSAADLPTPARRPRCRVLASVGILLIAGGSASQLEVGADDFRISEMGPDGNTSFYALEPAVAYNPDDDEYLVVWSGRDDSTDEREIFGQRIDAATGAQLGSDFRISEMGPMGDPNLQPRLPAVAYNPDDGEYLVVWSSDQNDGSELVDDELEIFGQRLTSDGLQTPPDDFRVSQMGPDGDPSYFAREPAVAYNADAGEYLVVWEGQHSSPDDEQEIYGQRVAATGPPEIGNDFRISQMGPPGDPNVSPGSPDVAYDSTDQQYLVVWHSDENSATVAPGEFEIYGQRLGSTGTTSGGEIRVSRMGTDGDADSDAFSPAVVYNPFHNEYVVVWSGRPLPSGFHDVFGQRLDGTSGAEVGPDDFRVSATGLQGAFVPTIAHDAANDEYLVVWHDADMVGTLGAQRLTARGEEIGRDDFLITRMGVDNPAFGADRPDVAYDPTNGEYLVVWSGDRVLGENEIFGQRLVATFLDLFIGDAVDWPAGSSPPLTIPSTGRGASPAPPGLPGRAESPR